MAKAKAGTKRKVSSNGANLGFEAKLWTAADKLRGNMEPSDYKHVSLGLIFLKYISDAFEAKREALLKNASNSLRRVGRRASLPLRYCGNLCACSSSRTQDRGKKKTSAIRSLRKGNGAVCRSLTT